MTTIPTWGVVLLGLAGPAVALLNIIAGWLGEGRRQGHERQLRLNDERVKTYASFVRVTKRVEVDNDDAGAKMLEAHAEIELLTDDSELRKAADELVGLWVEAQVIAQRMKRKAPNPYRTPEFQTAMAELNQKRAQFLRLARAELNTGSTEQAALPENSPEVRR